MVTKQRSKIRSTEPATPPAFSPLPPPRKSKLLLSVAGVLVVLWIAFLLSLALHLFGR